MGGRWAAGYILWGSACASCSSSSFAEMQSLAASLPEYLVVMEKFGVGPVLGPQLMTEIGNVLMEK